MAKINIQLIGKANRKTAYKLYNSLASLSSLTIFYCHIDAGKKQLLIETDFIDCLNVSEEVFAFVEKCTPLWTVLKECSIFGRVKWSMLITVISDDETIHPSACLSSETIHFLSKLRADVGFSYLTLGEY